LLGRGWAAWTCEEEDTYAWEPKKKKGTTKQRKIWAVLVKLGLKEVVQNKKVVIPEANAKKKLKKALVAGQKAERKKKHPRGLITAKWKSQQGEKGPLVRRGKRGYADQGPPVVRKKKTGGRNKPAHEPGRAEKSGTAELERKRGQGTRSRNYETQLGKISVYTLGGSTSSITNKNFGGYVIRHFSRVKKRRGEVKVFSHGKEEK